MTDKNEPQQNGRKAPPPLRITWGTVNDKNIKLLQRLNTSIFPIKYSDAFYKEAVNAPEGFVKLAFFNEILVAAVCCRKEIFVENHAQLHDRQRNNTDPARVVAEVVAQSNKYSLYILTLGVLAPYRERGIGRQLLNHVFDLVKTSPVCKDVIDIYVHVQVGNDDAISFYQNNGFECRETLVGYYKRLDPADCIVLRKSVVNNDKTNNSS